MCEYCRRIKAKPQKRIMRKYDGSALVKTQDGICIMQELIDYFGKRIYLLTNPITICPICKKLIKQ